MLWRAALTCHGNSKFSLIYATWRTYRESDSSMINELIQIIRGLVFETNMTSATSGRHAGRKQDDLFTPSRRRWAPRDTSQRR